MRAATTSLTAVLLATAAALLAAASAGAAPYGPPARAQALTIGSDGTSQPVYDFATAVRERVYIPQPGIDQDDDGTDDDVAIEIMRPDVGPSGDRVPAIIDPSPYYTTVCRGNEGQCIGDADGDGLNDKWPLFVDNYFVPRGYAVILAESDGTANSSGCPLHGGPGDIAGMTSVVDWLNGRAPGYTDLAHTHPATADWATGDAAMIGKSYDGTLTEGVAATGVAGLRTIVPESAIDDWYSYSRMGGIRFNTHYPAALSNQIVDAGRRTLCSAPIAAMSAAGPNGDGDATGDINLFWEARDYLQDVGHVRASVFAAHGLQDDNVRMYNLATWWAGLAANDVPRKLWLLREGHVDPFDSRRTAWVDTLHRWFDYWLGGVQNGIMDAPRVDVETSADHWDTYADWPLPGTQDADVYLRADDQAGAGTLGRDGSSGVASSVTFTSAGTQSETTMMNDPTGSQASRRVFLSPPLVRPLHLSGTPVVDLHASLSTAQSNLGALLVDYGDGDQISRSGDGIQTRLRTDIDPDRDCVGSDPPVGSPDYSACYIPVAKRVGAVTQWRVTNGILDSSNRDSLLDGFASPVTPSTMEDFPIKLVPQDFTFAAGHRVGVVLVGDYTSFSSVRGTANAVITVDTEQTKVVLPVVGGPGAAYDSGLFGSGTTPPAISDPPADMTVPAAGADGATVTYAVPTATDDFDPDAPGVTCDPASGSVFPVGTTTVTCTATDTGNNTSTRTFQITVTAPPPADDGTGDQDQGGGDTTNHQDDGGTGTTPPPAAPPASTPPADTPKPPVPPAVTSRDHTAPRLRALRLHGHARHVTLDYTASETGTLIITFMRAGTKPAVKTARRHLTKGHHTLAFAGASLRPGRCTVTLRLRDAHGNTRTLHATLTIQAPARRARS